MRKLLFFTLIVLLMAGTAYAVTAPSSPNVVYIDGHRESPEYPTVEVRLVRYGYATANYEGGLSSGDPVRWDLNSADGITISGCITSFDAAFAGVLVTGISTSDNGTFDLSDDDSWGYIAVRGYCLAKVAAYQRAGRVMHTGEGPIALQNERVMQTLGEGSGVSLDTGIMLLETTTTSARLAPVIMY